MDLSKVTLLEAIEWLKKENYILMNGRKGYINCKCSNNHPFHIVYIPKKSHRKQKTPGTYSDLGYIMCSYMSDYDLFIAMGNLHKENEYMAIGMFKENDNITRINVKGMNHIVENGSKILHSK